MKRLVIKLYDLFLSIFIFATSWVLTKYRKRGPENLRLTKNALNKIGVFPLIDHYYEPKFNFTENEKDNYQNRELLSIKLNPSKQIKFLKNLKYEKELLDLNLKKGSKKFNFYINNGSFEEGDAEIYYQLIRYIKPKKIIEVGSGYSTLIAMEALKKNNNSAKIKCIEPFENKWLEKLEVEVLREPLENLSINWQNELERNDIFFLDSSHIIRPDGDVLKFYLEILPNLKSGVIIHIHDIFTPKNYLPNWTFDKMRLWNEQYLLEGILINSNKYEILLSLNYLKSNYYEKLLKKSPYLEKEKEPGSIYLRVI